MCHRTNPIIKKPSQAVQDGNAKETTSAETDLAEYMFLLNSTLAYFELRTGQR